MNTKALCVVMMIAGSALAEEHTLDGHTYEIQFQEKSGGAPTKDTLLFRNGRFRSTACEPYGFGAASYGAHDPATFSAQVQSKKEGRIEWHGTLRGEAVEGSFVWSKPGKAPIEYTFKGSVAAATPPKGFDRQNAKDHLLKHQTYPATRAQLIASCDNLVDFTAADKKWFAESLPEGTYQSAADVMKVLAVNP
jgi:hypothetical protein